jgi:hypothetical protein
MVAAPCVATQGSVVGGGRWSVTARCRPRLVAEYLRRAGDGAGVVGVRHLV